MIVYSFDHIDEESKELQVRARTIARGQKVLSIAGRHRPVVVLSASIETRKRLLEVHDNDGEVVDAEEEMSERSEEEPRPSATVPPCGDEPLQATEGDEESEESLSCSQGPGEPTP